MRQRAAVGLVLLATLVLAGCGGSEPAAQVTSSASAVATATGTSVLDGQRLTVLDQAIAYPSGKGARISSEVVELQPGQQTGWLRQRTPTFVYVLSGTWSEEYDAGVTKDFAAGTGFMQAQGVWHNGSNAGQEVARVLVVHLGAKGLKDTARR
jgi:quercetin dioxygenase-like cupin family protein